MGNESWLVFPAGTMPGLIGANDLFNYVIIASENYITGQIIL